uniref:AlNc14C107G6269 protein n=1 Tax=Albugo laibachii Nc14 TaxID=890382 RepID=F0WI62_9STRA|nr:AlNc14C107G6269 [Albugo laibachii Nc14]|eukprot:CCA20940.1 AlNc14C107G6269 [Albugo laibachii Nc14]
MEWLIVNLMRDMVRYCVEHTQLPPVEPEFRMGSASSVFTQFLDARRHRDRTDSLSEPMGVYMPFVHSQPQAQHQQQLFPIVQATAQVHMQPSQQFFPQQNLGVKTPTVKDMELPIECSIGKEKYRGLGAEFKDWVYSSWMNDVQLNSSVGVNGLKSSR